MDAANILKPALGRGEIQVIGATTLDEYRKYIEKDAALERRFQPVHGGRAHAEEASVQILKGLRDKYEAHHKLTDHRRGPGGRRDAVRPVYQRPVPAGQGHRPDGRGRLAGCAWRRSTSPPDLKSLEEKIDALAKEKEAAIDEAGL